MLIDLKGKVALVTGAGRGIGREIATTLAAEGAITVVTDVRPEYLDALTAEWKARGWRGEHQRCDVRDAARIAEVVGAVVAAHGRIDILVNNAGVAPGGPIETLSEEVWDLNQDVNLKGTFLMCRAVAPVMKRQRGAGSSMPRPTPPSRPSWAAPPMPRPRRACTTSPACWRGARPLERHRELLCPGHDPHRDEPLRRSAGRAAAPAP